MNAQRALELAEDELAEEFIFSLEYYGSGLGYLVNMINETYDTYKSKSEPYFYWGFLVNDVPSSTGIDKTKLQDGDVVTFTFTRYLPGGAGGGADSAIDAKHGRRAT